MIQGFAGVIYPNAYHSHQSIEPMLEIADGAVSHKKVFYQYKNISLGTFEPGYFGDTRKGVHIVFYGNVSNIEAIRSELLALGYAVLQAHTSEILLHAYTVWGLDFLKKLSGGFSLGIIDIQKNRLYLARDHLGQRNLYWYHDHKHFLFATDIKSLLVTGLIPQKIAQEALASYLYLGYIPQDYSPIAGVNKLLPCYYLQYNLNDHVSIHSYWSYSACFQEQIKEPSNNLFVEDFENNLSRSLVGKKDLTCFLQTDLSSYLFCDALKRLDIPFTCYEECSHFQNTVPENSVSMMIDSLTLSKTSVSRNAKTANESLVPMLWHIGEPVANPELLGFWELANAATPKPREALLMCGGDIMLGTYYRYFFNRSHHHYQSLYSPSSLLCWLSPLLKLIYRKKFFSILRHLGTNSDLLKYLQFNAIFNTSQLKELSSFLGTYFHPEILIQKFYRMNRVFSDFVNTTYLDMKTTLPDAFLGPLNQISHAHGISFHYPFLDVSLVEFIAKVQKYCDSKSYEQPYLANLLLERHFPRAAPFKPLSQQTQHYLPDLSSSLWKDNLRLLSKGVLAESGFISKAWFHCLNKPLSPQRQCQVWTILCLEIWYRLFIYGPIPTRAPNMDVNSFLSYE